MQNKCISLEETITILTLTQFGVVNLFLRMTEILCVLIFMYCEKELQYQLPSNP